MPITKTWRIMSQIVKRITRSAELYAWLETAIIIVYTNKAAGVFAVRDLAVIARIRSSKSERRGTSAMSRDKLRLLGHPQLIAGESLSSYWIRSCGSNFYESPKILMGLIPRGSIKGAKDSLFCPRNVVTFEHLAELMQTKVTHLYVLTSKFMIIVSRIMKSYKILQTRQIFVE